MTRPERLHAFQVMAYSRKNLIKAMALTSARIIYEPLPEVPMEKDPTYLGYAVLGMSWYRIYVKPESVEACAQKLDVLHKYEVLGGWDHDKMWNR